MGCCTKKAIQVKHIVQGWTNLVLKKPTSKAKERLKICRHCNSNRWKGMRMWCEKCHCFIPAKVRIPEEKCLLEKWS